MAEQVEAAVAVILRQDGQVLLAKRPDGKPWAGWWEFPGGKIEAGEAPFHALQRELHEELGIEAVEATPWLVRTFSYPERTVTLRFFHVRAWQGEPDGREGQTIRWQYPSALEVSPMLPANAPVLQALCLPPVYAITHLAEMGETRFFSALEHALRQGLRLVQVREKQLDAAALHAFAARVVALCRLYGARALLNGAPSLAKQIGAHGVHLSTARLMALDQKPQGLLCAASCHNAQELAKAVEIGADFVLLSPVLPTLSHPNTPPLGWSAFSALCADYPLPVYALGGLHPHHLKLAWHHGAHGIAMQRAAWEQG